MGISKIFQVDQEWSELNMNNCSEMKVGEDFAEGLSTGRWYSFKMMPILEKAFIIQNCWCYKFFLKQGC